MRPVIYNYESNNEYTAPLAGEPYYRNSGIIYAVDCSGNKYAVSRIDFERYDEQNYQYVFTPEWSVIDALPASVFQGIPGLDLSLRFSQYYRVNITPNFIAERTPSENREDLWELLEEVELDYYDRFEWLIRTNMRCGTDNLIVERAKEARHIIFDSVESLPNDIQPGDVVAIQGFRSLATTARRIRTALLRILISGAQIIDETEGRNLSEEERNTLLKFILIQESIEAQENKQRHKEGVNLAKRNNKYAGRKKIAVDPHLLEQIVAEFRNNAISEEEAMRRVGIASRSTFYRRIKELSSSRKFGELNG